MSLVELCSNQIIQFKCVLVEWSVIYINGHTCILISPSIASIYRVASLNETKICVLFGVNNKDKNKIQIFIQAVDKSIKTCDQSTANHYIRLNHKSGNHSLQKRYIYRVYVQVSNSVRKEVNW